MNILHKVTWEAMKKNRTRTVVTVIGVILSAAMFMAVVTLGFSLQDYLLRGYTYENGDYYVRFSYTSQEQRDALLADERVSSGVEAQIHGFYFLPYPEGYGSLDLFPLASADKQYFETMNIYLKEGRLPENSRELLVSEFVMTRLDATGRTAKLGGEVTLDILTNVSHINFEGEVPNFPETEAREYAVTYTIVGVMEDVNNILDTTTGMAAVLTLADGSEPETLWYTVYAKTYLPSDAYAVAEEDYGRSMGVNNDVLLLLGATRYSNMNTVIIGVCAVLIAIIMVGSVSLIYNAFAISVAERTKQFGLLRSVGATRKQLRNSVLFEGFVLCLLGLPVGILCGWGGIGVTLHLMEPYIAGLFSFGGYVELQAVISPVSIVCAAVIGVVTVLLSAAGPARRATRVDPVAAIRQSEDYKVSARMVGTGKLTQMVFGLPGLLAKKYYAASRRKYRNIVVSLVISVVLFLSAASLGTGLRRTTYGSVNVSNYDFLAFSLTEAQQELLVEFSQTEDIETVWLDSESCLTVLPLADVAPELVEFHQYHDTDSYAIQGEKLMADVSVSYVEDEIFVSWLKEQHIDPEPYLDPENPTALVLQLSATFFGSGPEGNERRTVTSYGVVDSLTELPYYNRDIDWVGSLNYTDHYWSRVLTEDGLCFHAVSKEAYDAYDGTYEELCNDYSLGDFYLVRQENGIVTYHRYDPLTQVMEQEPAVMVTAERETIRLGQRVETMELADAYSDFYSLNLVLPLSARTDDGSGMELGIKTKGNAEAIRTWLTEKDIPFNDYLASQQQMRGVLLLIDVFSYGFIILISLICVTNVFNTISTNIALRRRDFGMLRSVGMKTREIYRMMNFECLIFGGKALLWGLPLGIGAAYGIYLIFQFAYETAFTLPWNAITVAVVCVFVVVFSTMFYAVAKLRKDNPIEAIRQENL